MEFLHLGEHCSEEMCHRLDFLPTKCTLCLTAFCRHHYTYSAHSRSNNHLKDNQVPTCPVCKKPVPVPRGQNADQIVAAHIDGGCNCNKASKQNNKNKCSLWGCKGEELTPIICNECGNKVCMKHRNELDHMCGPSVQRTAVQMKFVEARMPPLNMFRIVLCLIIVSYIVHTF